MNEDPTVTVAVTASDEKHSQGDQQEQGHRLSINTTPTPATLLDDATATTTTAAALRGSTADGEETPAPVLESASTLSSNENQSPENDTNAYAPSKKVPLTRLLALAKPESPVVFLALVLMVVAEALGLYNPLLLANAYNYLVYQDPSVTSEDRMSLINQTMITVIALHLASVCASYGKYAILGATGERVVARLRNDLYSSILNQEIAFFDEHKTGELVSRLSSDTTLLQQATSQAFPEVLLGLVKLVVCMALMFWISPSLAGVTIGTVALVFVLCMPFGKWMGELSKRYQDVLGLAQTVSTEALGAMRTVQSFAAEDRERQRYRDRIGDPAQFPWWWPTTGPNTAGNAKETTYRIGFFKALVVAMFFTIVFGLGFGSLYVCLWYGFKLVNDQVISLGALTAFQSYVFQIGGALGQTSSYIAQLVQAQGASGRIFYLLDRVPEIPKSSPGGSATGAFPVAESRRNNHDEEDPAVEQAATATDTTMQGLVEFRDVDFSYPSRPSVPVLSKFNLTIPPNTTAALVGASGSGKSTVVALLQRFYDVNSGSVLVDGKDIRELDVHWLRSNIGFVQQEPVLFGMTCRDNVTYGLNRKKRDDHQNGEERGELANTTTGCIVSQDELEAVCRAARAHDFIVEWPDGYDTLVGERGVKLSGGQKQRLSIARALLVNPRILVLDEATSSLDAESEHLVQEAIQKAVVGRTVLIVAHRLSTIQNADQIVVMDNCRIVDVGNHSELLRRCNKYQDLIKRQSLVGELPPDVRESLSVTI